MSQVIYLAMAYDAGNYDQSDYVYLLKLGDGRLIGYSDEFEVATQDISAACSEDKHHSAVWFGWPGSDPNPDWRPASLEELRAQHLEPYLIGWKRGIEVKAPIQTMGDKH